MARHERAEKEDEGIRYLPPRLSPFVFERERLSAILEKFEGMAAVWIAAPGGYGKTTVMLQWYAALRAKGLQVRWLSLDAHDSDAARLLKHLAGAIQPISHASEGPAAEPRSHASPDTQDPCRLYRILEDTLGVNAPFYLFIDDAHNLSEEGIELIGEVIKKSGPLSHFVVASREAFPKSMGRLLGQGLVSLLNWQNLRFTAEETAEMLGSAGLGASDVINLDEMHRRADGWPAAVQIALTQALLSANDPFDPDQPHAKSYSVSFDREYFRAIPNTLREFAVATSILDILSAPLCDAMLGTNNAADILDELSRGGFFTYPLDRKPSTYRYHNLFAECLQAELARDQKRFCEMHHAAACWLERNGEIDFAIQHWIEAGDLVRAAKLLDSASYRFIDQGQIEHFLSYVTQIPLDVRRGHPSIRLCEATTHSLHLNHGKAAKILEEVASSLRDGRSTGDRADDLLLLRLAHAEMMHLQFLEEPQPFERAAERVLSSVPQNDYFIRGTAAASLINARRLTLSFANTQRLENEARDCFQRSGTQFGPVWLNTIIGAVLLQQARFDEAVDSLRSATGEAESITSMSSDLSAMPALLLAMAQYEIGAFADAQELIDRHLSSSDQPSFVEPLIAGHTVNCRLLARNGDAEAAREALDRAWRIAEGRELPRLQLHIIHEKVRYYLSIGEPHVARQVARAAAIEGDPGMPKNPDVFDEIANLTRLRLAIASSPQRLALIATATSWMRRLADRGSYRSSIIFGLQRVKLLIAEGDRTAAQRALYDLLSRPPGNQPVSLFQDEGTLVCDLLRPIADAKSDGAETLAIINARHILSYSQSEANPAAPVEQDRPFGDVVQPLSSRQVQILRRADCGRTNREIAEEIGLSEGTVKWHFQQIFESLGRRRRMQAVLRAKELDIIPR